MHELEQVIHNIYAAQMRTQQDFMQSSLSVRQRANKAFDNSHLCTFWHPQKHVGVYYISLLIETLFWANSQRVSCTDHNNHLSLIKLQILVPWAGWRWSRWAFSLQCSQFVSLCQTDFFAVILHRHRKKDTISSMKTQHCDQNSVACLNSAVTIKKRCYEVTPLTSSKLYDLQSTVLIDRSSMLESSEDTASCLPPCTESERWSCCCCSCCCRLRLCWTSFCLDRCTSPWTHKLCCFLHTNIKHTPQTNCDIMFSRYNIQHPGLACK